MCLSYLFHLFYTCDACRCSNTGKMCYHLDFLSVIICAQRFTASTCCGLSRLIVLARRMLLLSSLTFVSCHRSSKVVVYHRFLGCPTQSTPWSMGCNVMRSKASGVPRSVSPWVIRLARYSVRICSMIFRKTKQWFLLSFLLI